MTTTLEERSKRLFSQFCEFKTFSIFFALYVCLTHALFSGFFHVPEKLLWVDYSGGWLNPIWIELDHTYAYCLGIFLYVSLVVCLYCFLEELSGSRTLSFVTSLIIGLSPTSLSLLLIQDNIPFLFGLFLTFSFFILRLKHSLAAFVPVLVLLVLVPEMLPLTVLFLLLKRWPYMYHITVKDTLVLLLMLVSCCGYIYVVRILIHKESLYPVWLLFEFDGLKEYIAFHCCELTYIFIRFFSVQSKILIEFINNQTYFYIGATLIISCVLSLFITNILLRKVCFLLQWIVLSYICLLGLPQSWFMNDRLLFVPSAGILLVVATCFEEIKKLLKRFLNFKLLEYFEVNLILLLLLTLFSVIVTLSELRVWSSTQNLYAYAASSSEKAADAQHAVGQLSIKDGLVLKAIESFRRALQANPKKYMHLSNTIGQLHYNQQDYNTATQWFLVSSKNNELDGIAYYWLGKCSFELGGYIEAKEYFVKSIPLIDNKGDVYLELFRLSLIDNNLHEAEEYLSKSISLNGKTVENVLWNGVLQIKQEKFKEGLYVFESLQNEVNRKPAFLEWQMVGYASIGSIENAKKILEYLTTTQKNSERYKTQFDQAQKYYFLHRGMKSERVNKS